jgi:hypothetical protein
VVLRYSDSQLDQASTLFIGLGASLDPQIHTILPLVAQLFADR